VSVDKEPEFKPVSDFADSKPVVSATTPPAAVIEEKPLIIPRRDRKQEDKPGFFSKVNPVRWFKDENKPVEQAAAKAVPAREAAPPPRQTYRPPITTVPDPKPEPPRVIPRYQYRKNIPLKNGNRSTAEKVFQQGTSAHQQRRLAEAMQAYQNATTIDPSYYDAHYNLGVAAYQSRNLPLALAANELALAAKPTSLDARYNFALTLRDANYPVDAANELKTMVNTNPDEVRAHFALANLYAQVLDQPALARKHYLAVLGLNSSHPEAPLIRQWLASNQ
jgi:tetratricopeptide (TPR) repeat protein